MLFAFNDANTRRRMKGKEVGILSPLTRRSVRVALKPLHVGYDVTADPTRQVRIYEMYRLSL